MTPQNKAALDALETLTRWASEAVSVKNRGRTVPCISSLSNTIRAALENAPEEVTVDEFQEKIFGYLSEDCLLDRCEINRAILNAAEKYPHGIKIVQEKVDG